MFGPGDDVFGDILSHMGGFAEYVCVPQTALAAMPAGLTYEQAAALPQAGAIAWQGIRDKGQVQPGQKVLINGGGGGSGMYAVQLAKLAGAEVTGVDNAEKLEFMRSLGAGRVIDYAREDFTRTGRRYDLILDLAAHRPGIRLPALADARRTLPVCWRVGGHGPAGPADRAADRKRRAQEDTSAGCPARCPAPGPHHRARPGGKIATVIDRRFPLSQVPEALRYLGEGHAKGKVVVTFQ